MILKPVTQLNLEAYQEHLIDLCRVVKSAAKTNRMVIEAARSAGIADGLPDDLLTLEPWQIVEFSQRIITHKDTALQPPSGE